MGGGLPHTTFGEENKNDILGLVLAGMLMGIITFIVIKSL